MKNKFLILFIVFTLFFAVSCAPKKQQATKKKPMAIGSVQSSVVQTGQIQNIKITTDKANIRAGCSNDTAVVQTCAKDVKLDVISDVSDWYAVKLTGNKIGFVSKQECKPVVVEDKKTTVPKTSEAVPQGTTTPKTPTAKTNKSTLTASEQQMLKLINDARVQNNLSPLKVDMELTNVARIKAQDMIDNNYFSHNSSKYGDPFDMMKAFGIKYIQAGENIAGNQSVESAQNALMNSPGHRKNILSPDFTHIGLGIQKGGTYGNMFSQMFISKPQ